MEQFTLLLIAQGYSTKQIAAKLEVLVKTVETYRSRAMKKLNLRCWPELVRYAAAQGWLADTTNGGLES
jgi:two-component system response regulator NreC